MSIYLLIIYGFLLFMWVRESSKMTAELEKSERRYREIKEAIEREERLEKYRRS